MGRAALKRQRFERARRRSSFSTLFAISPVALVRKMSSAADGCRDPAHRRSAYTPSPSGSPHRSRLYQSQGTSAGRAPACSSRVLAAVRPNGCSDKVAASAMPHCRQAAFRPFYRRRFNREEFAKSSLHVQDECPAIGGSADTGRLRSTRSLPANAASRLPHTLSPRARPRACPSPDAPTMLRPDPIRPRHEGWLPVRRQMREQGPWSTAGSTVS